MRCSNCHFENPDHSKFCIECGAAFQRRCLKCGFDNLPQAKFCGHCGSSFAEAAASSIPDTSRPELPEKGDASKRIDHDGERRPLTILFCDVVGSTVLSAQLDPEQWRETLAGFHRVAAAAITQFDGHVAKNLGDGVMA